MSRQSSFSLPPQDAPCVPWPEPFLPAIADYCTYLPIGDRISLCEYTQTGEYFYSIVLEADETPLIVCALDRFVTANLNQGAGRRCDYALIGWYNGDSYVVFVELRKELDTEEHWENKLEQVRQTIQLLCHQNPIFGSNLHASVPEIFNQACDPMPIHKTLGLVIPAEHSRARAIQNKTVAIDGNGEVDILALPYTFLRGQETSWSRLLNYAVPPQPYKRP